MCVSYGPELWGLHWDLCGGGRQGSAGSGVIGADTPDGGCVFLWALCLVWVTGHVLLLRDTTLQGHDFVPRLCIWIGYPWTPGVLGLCMG